MSLLAARHGPTRWWRFAPIDERRCVVEVRGVLAANVRYHYARRLAPLLLVVGWSGMACRETEPTVECQPSPGAAVWVERRFPPMVPLADTAFASLSLSIGSRSRLGCVKPSARATRFVNRRARLPVRPPSELLHLERAFHRLPASTRHAESDAISQYERSSTVGLTMQLTDAPDVDDE